MTAKKVFCKTLVFSWVKLGLGLLNILIAVVLFAILMGISVLFGSEGATVIMFLIWLAVIGVVNFVLNHYIGYLVKAGHVAVIATAFKTGTVPADPLNTGKAMVKARFGTSNIYFALDKLIAGSVKQLQRTLGRITDGLLGSIPGMDGVKKLMNMFLDISLGYIDECCLGYTFYHPEQNAYKSAADGVVIYTRNWKILLKNAAKTTLIVILSIVVATLVAFIMFGGLFHLLGWSGFVAFVLSLFMAWTIKYAFIDSWILVRMMSCYMEAAPNTQITFDLYEKLSGLSGKFKELVQKGRNETLPQPKTFDTEKQPADSESSVTTGNIQPARENNPPRFCPSCGSMLVQGKTFCGSCGVRIG